MKEQLANILQTIQQSAEKAGRKPEDITLLAASKYADVSQVQKAYDLGLRFFGENRSEGLLSKKDSLPDDICWHFIGQLQTNKVKYIIGNVDLIHSLDRLSLATELQKRALAKQTSVNALIEVCLDDREQRGGILPERLEAFLSECAIFERIHIKGLMCVAPLGATPAETEACFAKMKDLFDGLSRVCPDNASMEVLSMGMSHDYPLAIKHGATLVRIGSALFQPNKN